MADIRQNPDGSLGVMSESDGLEVFRVGGPKTPTAVTGFTHRAENTAKVPFGVATGALTGSLITWQPPNPAEDVLVTRVLANIQVSAAVTMDCGVVINASLTGSNIINAMSMTVQGLFDNITDKGVNGKSRQLLPAGSFVTATPSATPVGLVGAMYITYIKA